MSKFTVTITETNVYDIEIDAQDSSEAIVKGTEIFNNSTDPKIDFDWDILDSGVTEVVESK